MDEWFMLEMSSLYLYTVNQKSFHWCLKKTNVTSTTTTTTTALPNFSKCTGNTKKHQAFSENTERH